MLSSPTPTLCCPYFPNSSVYKRTVSTESSGVQNLDISVLPFNRSPLVVCVHALDARACVVHGHNLDAEIVMHTLHHDNVVLWPDLRAGAGAATGSGWGHGRRRGRGRGGTARLEVLFGKVHCKGQGSTGEEA